MKNNNGQNLNFAAKAFLGVGAVCGVIGAFIPPVAIAAATLALVGGVLEIAEAIENKKTAREEPRSEKFVRQESIEKTYIEKLAESRTANKNKTQVKSQENLISEI